jgi:hypothetical protein
MSVEIRSKICKKSAKSQDMRVSKSNVCAVSELCGTCLDVSVGMTELLQRCE